jgi:hypothetical protein
MIKQVKFDLDLIEVSNGFCFSISERAFIANAIPSSKIGKLSPRAFVPYDCSTPPQPRYFQEGVLSSFPGEEERVNFLNKFYKCLFASKMPQKTRKFVVAGPRDSGKTSRCNVFHRIIPPECIASVTNEGQFSAAMITETTQMVIIEEWSSNRMQSDLAKTVLQGGWMVTSVKHGPPRCVNNNSPFYITTNNVPDFRKEDENVKRRIRIFQTTSLPNTIPGIDSWIFDHAMDCIAWTAEEIHQHRHLICHEELWYENCKNAPVASVDGESLWKRHEIDQITKADMQPLCQKETTKVDERTIHPGFTAEMHSRRLARKRRDRRQILYDTSTDDEGKICRRIEDNNDDGDTQREQSYHDPPMGCTCSAIDQLSNASQHTREKAAEVESSPKTVEGEHDGGEEYFDMFI